jgi:hypothetical protein
VWNSTPFINLRTYVRRNEADDEYQTCGCIMDCSCSWLHFFERKCRQCCSQSLQDGLGEKSSRYSMDYSAHQLSGSWRRTNNPWHGRLFEPMCRATVSCTKSNFQWATSISSSSQRIYMLMVDWSVSISSFQPTATTTTWHDVCPPQKLDRVEIYFPEEPDKLCSVWYHSILLKIGVQHELHPSLLDAKKQHKPLFAGQNVAA